MKNLINILLILGVFLICSYFWSFINLEFQNTESVVGQLTLDKYNPNTDTIRYILLTCLTTFTFFLLRFFQQKKKINLNIYFKKNNFKILKSFNLKKHLIFYLLIFLIFFDFTSDNHFFYYYDALHDGDNLTPSFNFTKTFSYWSSTLPIHGLSNIIYGYLGWKIFNLETIGSLRYFYIIILITLKILLVFFSYQLTKLVNFSNGQKKILFLFLSIFLIKLVSFELPLNYSVISYRDIFVVIYLIFLIELFSKNFFNNKILFFLVVLSNTAIVLHYDIGTYLNLINLFLFVYFFISKNYKCVLFLLFSYFLVWLFFIIFFGIAELKFFISHYLHIVKYIDFIHGIEFPQPIFEMGTNSNSSRATKSLILIVISLCILVEIIFFRKENYFSSNSKIILFIIIVLGFVMFKNALGRSDSYHIKMSSEYPLLITYFFTLVFFSSSSFFKKYESVLINKTTHAFIILIFIFFSFNKSNFFDYKLNLIKFIKAPDNEYLNERTINFLKDASSILNKEDCIFNFTMDLGLPYLLKKKTCTRYFQTYTNSGRSIEAKYIDDLANVSHKYLIYKSPNVEVDNILVTDRLKFVNEYILKNYINIYNKNGFIILKKN